VILAVDPGESCGVSIWQRGRYVSNGVCDGYLQTVMFGWLDRAAHTAKRLDLPIVLVREKPPMGGRGYRRGGSVQRSRNLYGAASVLGSRKVWQTAWETSEHTVNNKRVDVLPQTWRRFVLSTTGGPLLERVEIDYATRVIGHAPETRDEAAAVGIGRWACHAGEVRAKLGKRVLAAESAELTDGEFNTP
jgi:hypothetical protein